MEEIASLIECVSKYYILCDAWKKTRIYRADGNIKMILSLIACAIGIDLQRYTCIKMGMGKKGRIVKKDSEISYTLLATVPN